MKIALFRVVSLHEQAIFLLSRRRVGATSVRKICYVGEEDMLRRRGRYATSARKACYVGEEGILRRRGTTFIPASDGCNLPDIPFFS